MLLAAGAMASTAMAAPVISGLSVEPLSSGGDRLKFTVSESIAPRKTFTLGNPDRIVIDIPSAKGQGVALPSNYQGSLIRAIRFGQFDPQTSRIVVDLTSPGVVVSSQPGKVMVVDIAPAGTRTVVNAAPTTKPTPPTPALKPQPATPSAIPPEETKPLVMIDAGHGGQDPGAIGLGGIHEKDITLAYARALREELLRTGKYRVALTRDDDHFVMLTDRVAMARKIKADVFVSFHADSNPRPEAKGLSIYSLSETASDDESAALAERENKADIIQGIDLNTTDADVANILIDLTQRETMNKSAVLADAVVDKLHTKINRLPKAHRFAGFRVLKAPDIPSVLIELGFISNATDEKLLQSPEYRDLVVSSVAKGIDRYLAER